MTHFSRTLLTVLFCSVLVTATFGQTSTNTSNTTSDAQSDSDSYVPLVFNNNSKVGFNLINSANTGYKRNVIFQQQGLNQYQMIFDTAFSEVVLVSGMYEGQFSDPYGSRYDPSLSETTSDANSISGSSPSDLGFDPYLSSDLSYNTSSSASSDYDGSEGWTPFLATYTPPQNSSDTDAIFTPFGDFSVSNYQDSLTIKGLNVTLDNVTVGVCSNFPSSVSSYLLAPGSGDGIYGLGLDKNGQCPFLENLYEAGLISQKYFTLFLTYDPYNTDVLSELIVDGYDSTYVNDTSDFVYVPLVDNTTWSINIDQVSVNNTQDNSSIGASGVEAIISSGTPFIGLPFNMFYDFLNALGNDTVAYEDENGYAVQCPNVDFTSFPILYFQSGSQVFAIPPEAYLTFDGSRSFASVSLNNPTPQTMTYLFENEDEDSDSESDSEFDSSSDSSSDGYTDTDSESEGTDTSDGDEDYSSDSNFETDASYDGDTDDTNTIYNFYNYNNYYGGGAIIYGLFPYSNSYTYNSSTVITQGPIHLQPEALFNDLCWLNIQPLLLASENNIILGAPFLQSYYTLFDAENMRVGFVQAHQPVSFELISASSSPAESTSSNMKWFIIGGGILAFVILMITCAYCMNAQQSNKPASYAAAPVSAHKPKKSKKTFTNSGNGVQIGGTQKKKKHHHHKKEKDVVVEQVIYMPQQNYGNYPQVPYQQPMNQNTGPYYAPPPQQFYNQGGYNYDGYNQGGYDFNGYNQSNYSQV